MLWVPLRGTWWNMLHPSRRPCHHYHSTHDTFHASHMHAFHPALPQQVNSLEHCKRVFIPEAGPFPLVESWAHLTPPPPCTRPSDGGYGTAGRRPGGRPTDPASPLRPYWLSRGNRVMTDRSFPAAAQEARSRPAFDPVTPSLSGTSWCVPGANRKLSETHFSWRRKSSKMSLSSEEASFCCGCGLLPGHMIRSCEGMQHSSVPWRRSPWLLYEKQNTTFTKQRKKTSDTKWNYNKDVKSKARKAAFVDCIGDSKVSISRSTSFKKNQM